MDGTWCVVSAHRSITVHWGDVRAVRWAGLIWNIVNINYLVIYSTIGLSYVDKYRRYATTPADVLATTYHSTGRPNSIRKRGFHAPIFPTNFPAATSFTSFPTRRVLPTKSHQITFLPTCYPLLRYITGDISDGSNEGYPYEYTDRCSFAVPISFSPSTHIRELSVECEIRAFFHTDVLYIPFCEL